MAKLDGDDIFEPLKYPDVSCDRCQTLERALREIVADGNLRCMCGRYEYMLGKIDRCKWCLMKDMALSLLPAEGEGVKP